MIFQPHLIHTASLGHCWLQTCRLILEQGVPSRYDDLDTKEIANLTLCVDTPNPDDPLIRQYGDAAWLAWMHENFSIQKDVPELGEAPSYAVRLFNYAGQGLDQIDWVVRRLRADPESRSAAITTFMPLSDVSYVPCISLLDFWIPHDALDLVVYAHSLDFGKKAYGNLLELAGLQCLVAQQLACPAGNLTVHVKSAHLYETELDVMRNLLGTVVAA